jgi:hypothetical protein
MLLWGPDGDSFLVYARTQHDLGLQVAARHTPEETGCCGDCGRVFPCEEHEQAVRMSEHYRPWLSDMSRPPSAGWSGLG